LQSLVLLLNYVNMNICIIGTVCIDNNVSENSSYTSAGSPAMYMSKIFKQLGGCDINIITSYGQDFVQYLNGVNILPPQPNTSKTMVYENVSNAGLRTQKSYNRENAFEVDLDDSIIKALRQADIVFFAPLLPMYSRKYVESVISYLQDTALKVILPQGFYRNFDFENNVLVREFVEAKEILPLMDIAVVSEQDSPTMLVEAKDWALSMNVIPIVTLGAKGAVALKGREEIMLPADAVPESEIVDSVGSGEIFTAAFTYKYKQSGNLETAGKFANAVARQCLFYKSADIKIDLSKI
jgi:sugar/nucleoside kinase (ribokinase family)